MGEPERGTGWRAITTVGLAALLTFGVAELGLRQLTPPLAPLLEVEDGVRDLEASDPAVIVLGSSHARGFSVIRERLAEHFDDPDHLVQVAVERGKLSSYRWVAEHRLAPLLEDDGPRTQLRRLILVTEWWDACAPARVPDENVPGRAWTAGHFLADAADHGITTFNRNWISYQWQRLTRGWILASDRGVGRLPTSLMDLVRPGADARRAAEHEARIAWWNRMVEQGFDDPVCDDGTELAHLDSLLDRFRARGVELTIVLWPRMPSTLTPKGIETTVARYARRIAEVAETRGARVVDLTTSTPLADAHFMQDFDHTTAEGNRILADWGLAGPLRFLLEAPQ